MTIKTNVTLVQVQELAAKVQAVMFSRFVSGADDVSVLDEAWNLVSEHRLPLKWFSEAYADNDFERIFSVWDSGLLSMRGKSLYGRCMELVE